MREATAETVGKFSEFVVPDFLDKHQQVLPMLLSVIKELDPQKNDLTLQKAFFAMHEFTSNLDKDILPYLDTLMQLLMGYFTDQMLTSKIISKDVRYWTLNALGSVISSASTDIIPYRD